MNNLNQALFSAGIGERKALNQPEKWSEEMRHFVGKCLRQDPATRGTAELMIQVRTHLLMKDTHIV